MSKDRWLDGKLVECEFGFCETCGTPKRAPNAALCDGCWSIEHHLDSYFRDGGDKARRFVADALEVAKREEVRRKLIKEVSDTIPDQEDQEMGGEEERIRARTLNGVVRLLRDLDLTP